MTWDQGNQGWRDREWSDGGQGGEMGVAVARTRHADALELPDLVQACGVILTWI